MFDHGLDARNGGAKTAAVNTTSRKGAAATLVCLLACELYAAPPADQQRLASANNGFSFALLKQLAKDHPGKNIFISAYSVSTVLQMVCHGARGQTKAEMEQVLGTTGFQADALNGANRDVARSINSRGTNVLLTAANAIWYRKGTSFEPEFIACNQEFFGATVDALDFNDARSINVINAWAIEKTHGKINNFADGLLDPTTDLFLANAVYFKGKWDEPFEIGNTKDRLFHLRAGRPKKLPMMEKTQRFAYRHGTGYQAVRLPYQGWALAMYVFLPDSSSSLEKVLGLMNGDTWQRVTEPGFNERRGTVVLPRFKLEYGVELKQPLRTLGMRAAFGKADFSGLSSRPLFISAVRQRTFVEVKEEGTEASAVTGISVPPVGIEIDPPKPFQMIVDRPFLFLIEDKPTRTILFMGVVFEP
jgi:serine protease inhibitor